MNKSKAFQRLNASQSIDELLNIADRRQSAHWLLTYIDVFVLVVMLVVTLVSLSNFDTLEPTKSTLVATTQPKAIPVPVKSPKPNPTPTDINPIQETPNDSIALSTETPISPPPSEVVEPIVCECPADDHADVIADKTPAEPAAEPEPVSNEPQTAAIETQLNQQLNALGLADSIHIKVTTDYAELEIQDNILYRSSEATLTEEGQLVLTKLTPLLKQAQGLIYIEGHTDNRPINTVQFPSNWELGAARATSVLHFLSTQQIDAARMRAISYGDTQPIADNATADGRQKNRRVNIVIKINESLASPGSD